ncbi:MAG: cytidylate kinase [Flavobacteriales bacterium]|nr:cytidylate kinase [Flavobacteriales bacterium]
MKKINIAIDGHSSCGKSTIAKQLAQHFAYVYIDTGAMYRAVCLYCLQESIMLDGLIDEERLLRKLNQIEVSFNYSRDTNASETYLNGVNVDQDIRGLWVSENVSKVSKIKVVREKMVAIQQAIGEDKGVVMDGRDIGTVVFPDAELKLFVTASLEERARRRHAELEGVSLEDVIKNLGDRDFDDSTRVENPLKQAVDAIVIDNTNLSREEQFALILKHCQDAMQ